MMAKKKTAPPTSAQKARIYQLQTGYRPPVKEEPKPEFHNELTIIQNVMFGLNIIRKRLEERLT